MDNIDPLHAAAIVMDAHWRSAHTHFVNGHALLRDAGTIARNVREALGPENFAAWAKLNIPFDMEEIEKVINLPQFNMPLPDHRQDQG